MTTILDRIVSTKWEEISASRKRLPDEELARGLDSAAPCRDFRAALLQPSGMAIIAEVKKASPSAGVIRDDFDPVAIAKIYAQHGANCLSVLTDGPYFQGSLDNLRRIRAQVDLPLLRKDFILDRYQLLEARHAGADCVLLIAEILPGPSLPRLLGEARDLGLQTLVELYDQSNLPRVLASGAELIGINNRDLRTFQVRLEHTIDLALQIPRSVTLVSESGIRSREDVLRLRSAGVRAVLVGETLMRAPDIGAKLDELLGNQP